MVKQLATHANCELATAVEAYERFYVEETKGGPPPPRPVLIVR